MQWIRKDIERAIIGAVLIHHGGYSRVRAFLDRQSFSDQLHQEVWVVCGMLADKSDEINLRTGRQAILTARQDHKPGFVDDQAQNLAHELSQIAVPVTAADVLMIERNALALIECGIRDRFLEICQTVTTEAGAFYHVVCEWTQDITDYNMRSLEVLQEAVLEWHRVDPEHTATLAMIALNDEIMLMARRIKLAIDRRQSADPMPVSRYRSADGTGKRDTPVIVRSKKEYVITRPTANVLGDEIAKSILNGI